MSKRPVAPPSSTIFVPPKRDPDRPIFNLGGTKDDHRTHYTPFLVVRTDASDMGIRPLPTGTVFWESPDVWTEGSRGTNQPVVNEPTKVFARITNFGLQDATGVYVRFWWANPSITITEQTAHLIGTGTTAVLSNNSLVFRSPTDWVPVFENNGHECLFAQAFVPVFDPMTDSMHPVNDRHVGQKNENLVLLPAMRTFQFQVDAFNFTVARQHIIVEARRGVIPRDFARRFAGKTRWPSTLLDPARIIPVSIQVNRHSHCVVTGSRAGASRIYAETAGESATVKNECLGPALAAETQLFSPGEVRRVTITGALPASARPGEIHVIRITQRIGHVLTGGYTLYVTLDPHAK